MKNILGYYLYKLDRKKDKNFFDLVILILWRTYLNLKGVWKESDNKTISSYYLKLKSLKDGLLNQRYHYVSIEELVFWTTQWLERLPTDFDLVIGVPRSGLMVANLIALKRGKALSTPEDFLKGGKIWQSKNIPTEKVKKILLIDDSISSGETINKSYKLIKSKYPKLEITKAALIVTPEGRKTVDYYFKVITQPRVFEWNLLHAKKGRIGVDLDGVLCEECPSGVDKSERLYRKWLTNARVLLRPHFQIDVIISNRLEKYRTETERWLKENGIKYKELLLWDLDDKSKRGNLHAQNKINQIIKSKPDVFWESSFDQAQKIFKATKVPTLCIEKNVLIS